MTNEATWPIHVEAREQFATHRFGAEHEDAYIMGFIDGSIRERFRPRRIRIDVHGRVESITISSPPSTPGVQGG